MNLKEGTRRLALLLGVVGAILGGFASYLELQTVLNQRARHNKFEQLANSGVVQQERKRLQTPIDLSAGIVGGFIHDPSEVDAGGIKTINWAENYGVYSIETTDGQTLYATPAPSAWEYLWIPVFLFLGFFIPWGAVRAIGWTLEGFIHPLS